MLDTIRAKRDEIHAIVRKHKGVVFLLMGGLSLSAFSATPFTPTTGTELEQAVTDAKAAWTATSEPQEIVLAKGKYEISNELVLNFPVVFRGATGNPADVTVKHLNKGSNKYRVFTVDNPGAQLLNVTVTGGSLDCLAGKYSRLGAGVRVSKSSVDGSDSNMANNKGTGGVVSNCVFTGNSITYKNDAAIVYVNGPADKTLVTCCVVTNNSCSRQTDSNAGDSALGSIVHVDSGRFTSSIVGNNRTSNTISDSKQDITSIVEARGGSIENCRVNGNNVSASYDPTIVRTMKTGKVFNTVIADNSVALNPWSRADWPESSRYWAGADGSFSNCIVKGTGIVMPNASCICTNDLGYLEESAGDYRLSRFSVQRAAAEMNGVLTTGADLLGKPRVNASGLMDIGPIAYDSTVVKVAGACADCFSNEKVVLRVTADEGYGDAPTYYWTLTPVGGGAGTTFVTQNRTLPATIGFGTYDVSLVVSNLTAGTGSSAVSVRQDLKVHQRTFYAKPGNAGAAAPYATEATAAADLQTAINAVTFDGAEVVALPGVYEITSNVLIRARQITLRGSTGDPEDVIVRNTTTAKWRPGEWNEQKSCGEGRCLVLDAGTNARVESMTFENGKSFYAVTVCSGIYLGSWTKRDTWPAAGKGGVVSNCVVRNCSGGNNKYGIAPGIFARGPYLITHTVISNCTSGAGNSDGGRFSAVGLDLGGGARAEHCLIAGNSTSYYDTGKSYPEYGRGLVGGVMVRDDSTLRFSTVVGNSGPLVGGVNVNGTSARVENCIILGNSIMGEAPYCPATTNQVSTHRFNCWGMMVWSADSDLLGGTTPKGGKNIALIGTNEVAYVAAHPEAVDAAFKNTITDYAIAGSTGILSSKAETFRNAAKRDYRLTNSSEAIDRVRPEDAGDMPGVDLMGNPRLIGPRYDLGCYEARVRGLLLIVR